MVLQVGKGAEKAKEPFSDVQLPLPEVLSKQDSDEDAPYPEVHRTKKKWEVCKILSITLNILLILAVVFLAVKVCKLQKELSEVKGREEFEIKAERADEDENSIMVRGDVDREGHSMIEEIMAQDPEKWYRKVRFFLCVYRNREREGNWFSW